MKAKLHTLQPPTIREGGDAAAPVIVGYGAVFFDAKVPGTEYRCELWDGWTLSERIERGAFDAALTSGADIVALWAHDHSMPLGRMSRDTLRISSDDTGLRYEVDAPDTSWGKDAVLSIRRGDVQASSFGFALGDGYTDTVDNTTKTITRRITSIATLYEVSPVVIPAYTATGAGLRSADDNRALADLISRNNCMTQHTRTKAMVAIALAMLD